MSPGQPLAATPRRDTSATPAETDARLVRAGSKDVVFPGLSLGLETYKRSSRERLFEWGEQDCCLVFSLDSSRRDSGCRRRTAEGGTKKSEISPENREVQKNKKQRSDGEGASEKLERRQQGHEKKAKQQNVEKKEEMKSDKKERETKTEKKEKTSEKKGKKREKKRGKKREKSETKRKKSEKKRKKSEKKREKSEKKREKSEKKREKQEGRQDIDEGETEQRGQSCVADERTDEGSEA
ncbi:hypothetical protein TGVEG_262590 [Toxoplasma gondii VEG]|uniref:Uncharacterized protein n=2 Tax=Toxoplasma gondii TaxID=5811 RepID=V4Z990_TOXGV|nr:hypothetical protein TGVEG_262590 [Toxoplasma gondii VEG]